MNKLLEDLRTVVGAKAVKALAETANKAATEAILIMELYHELGSLQKVKMRGKRVGGGKRKVVGGRRRLYSFVGSC